MQRYGIRNRKKTVLAEKHANFLPMVCKLIRFVGLCVLVAPVARQPLEDSPFYTGRILSLILFKTTQLKYRREKSRSQQVFIVVIVHDPETVEDSRFSGERVHFSPTLYLKRKYLTALCVKNNNAVYQCLYNTRTVLLTKRN